MDDVVHVAPLRKLTFDLKRAKHIWDEHSHQDILRRFEFLDVAFCDDLINLGPSFISLQNLTDICVYSCKELINLLTSSTARGLVQLSRLRVTYCEQIEEIITSPRVDIENVIVFKRLRHLELQYLPSLKSFCSHHYTFLFPSLEKVIIIECRRLSMFCPGVLIYTPLLRGLEVATNKILWEINLDKTIRLCYAQQVHTQFKNSIIY